MIRKNVGRLSANGAFDTIEVFHIDGFVDGVSGDNNNEQMNPAKFHVSIKNDSRKPKRANHALRYLRREARTHDY